jgi:hypothetical protein
MNTITFEPSRGEINDFARHAMEVYEGTKDFPIFYATTPLGETCVLFDRSKDPKWGTYFILVYQPPLDEIHYPVEWEIPAEDNVGDEANPEFRVSQSL